MRGVRPGWPFYDVRLLLLWYLGDSSDVDFFRRDFLLALLALLPAATMNAQDTTQAHGPRRRRVQAREFKGADEERCSSTGC